MKYFTIGQDSVSARSKYLEYCNQYHPDKNPNRALFLEIQKEWEEFLIIDKYLPEILELPQFKPQMVYKEKQINVYHPPVIQQAPQITFDDIELAADSILNIFDRADKIFNKKKKKGRD